MKPAVRLGFRKSTNLSSLSEITALMVEASHLLPKVFVEDETEAKRHSIRIREISEACHEIVQTVSERLRHTFLSPIDREDIHSLMTALTGVVHQLGELASATSEYRVKHYTPQMVQLLNLLQEIVQEMDRIVPEVHKPTAIRLRLIAMNRLQKRSRDVCQEALRGLFRNASNMEELLIHTDLYNGLELIMKRCVKASSIAEMISLKNA